ncbi:TPA: hypothetical protein F8R99_14280 [Legionella pneumophila]|nr:hypothetical protein [Legionella pneumophila]
MKIVRVNQNNTIVEIVGHPNEISQTHLLEVPEECEIGWKYIDGQFIPRDKTTNELKMDALVKAVLTGDKTDLEQLNNP